jgi:Lon protease-like protein
MSIFTPRFANLPAEIPVFPLTGVLLLPGGELPLNIFEPRYINMVNDALAGDRLIAMAQPRCAHEASEDDENSRLLDPDGLCRLYPVACAGRITRFEETDDGCYLIMLKGVFRCQFDHADVITGGYRVAQPDWSGFEKDLDPIPKDSFDRSRLFRALKPYLHTQGFDVDWEALKEAPDERLITSLSMICPFAASEKQALLEAENFTKRADILTTLVEMAVFDGAGCDQSCQ